MVVKYPSGSSLEARVPYSPIVLDHFYNPRSTGRMENPTTVGQAGEPGKGNFMLLYMRHDGQRITETSFQTYGCAPAIAAGSLLAEQLVGQTKVQAQAWNEATINKALGGLPSHKRHCSRLAAEALADALSTWQQP